VVALSQLTNVHSLADLLDQGHVLPAHEAVEVIRQLAVDVAILHRGGKSHGRIVPSAIRFDDRQRPAMASCTDEGSGDFGGEWVPPGLRDQAFARLMDRLEGSGTSGDDVTSGSWFADSGGWSDPRQLDVYGLAAVLCRLITGVSADAYLRSPRVKGTVPEWLQPLLDRALGGGNSRFRDADDFLVALEASTTRRPADGDRAGAGRPVSEVRPGTPESALEICETSPSCLSGMRVGEVPASFRRGSRPEDANLPFTKLGHFEITARLGQGGMGEVYLGYESSLDRRVAIKVLPAEFARDPDLVRRFRGEATAAARLIHPNIIQIYFIGEDDGHQYFAMQYVDGMSLAQFLSRGNRPSVDEALAIIDEVLSGLAAAHRLGFVHRDIKPANILLDNAHRRALLADFGLVKSLEDTAATRTSAGAVLGTADYMAPEQGLGQTVDFRSDLYSLGVVLFQLLCGRLPFVGRDSTAVIYQHVHEPPPAVQELAAEVPAELATIVARLLAKSPRDRYQSAAEVLAEIRAIRAGRPLAGPRGRPDVRGPSGADPESEPTALLVDTSPVGYRSTLPELPAYRGAADAAPPVMGRRRVLAVLTGAALPALAGGVWFAVASPEQKARWFSGWTGPSENPSGEIRRFEGHPSEINGFALTADEERLFVGDRTGKVHIWDFRMGEKRKTLRAHSGPIRRLILSRDGGSLITASADQTLKKWNIDTGKQVTQFNGHVEVVTSVALVPGRDEIVSSSFDGTLIRWEMARGNILARYGSIIDEESAPPATPIDWTTLDRHITWARDVIVPPPGNRIMSAGNEGVVLIWDLDSGRVVERLPGNAGPIMCLALSPNGTQLLAGCYKKVLSLWDIARGELVRQIPHDSGTPASVAFSPNGRLALSGGADGLLRVWNAASGEELHQFEGHEGTVTSAQFMADGRRVVSGGEDRTVRVWKLPQSIV
jgi:serine/threonine protein kinase/WD40 repeat protein